MQQELITELVRVSVLAPVVVALCWFVWHQHRTLRDIEARRVEDVKAVNEKLLQLSIQWHATLSTMLLTAESQKETLRDLRQVLQSRGDP